MESCSHPPHYFLDENGRVFVTVGSDPVGDRNDTENERPRRYQEGKSRLSAFEMTEKLFCPEHEEVRDR
jgi:hypothetical protein